MLMSTILLALSSSIDSFGVGITYGIKKTKISYASIIILFILSFCITNLSIMLGHFFSIIISTNFSNILGSCLLIFMGIFIVYEALFPKEKAKSAPKILPKEYNFFIEFLGITINIIKNPISSDIDNSNRIDFKEALFLGVVMSLDAMCIGFGGGILRY